MLSKSDERRKDSDWRERPKRLPKKLRLSEMLDSEGNLKSKPRKRRSWQFKPLLRQLWLSNRLTKKQSLSVCKLNKNKLELKMKERERNKKLLKEPSERKKSEFFKLKEIKKELPTRRRLPKKKRQQPELPKLLSIRLLLKQWKSKDWHLKKKKEELLLKL